MRHFLYLIIASGVHSRSSTLSCNATVRSFLASRCESDKAFSRLNVNSCGTYKCTYISSTLKRQLICRPPAASHRGYTLHPCAIAHARLHACMHACIKRATHESTSGRLERCVYTRTTGGSKWYVNDADGKRERSTASSTPMAVAALVQIDYFLSQL